MDQPLLPFRAAPVGEGEPEGPRRVFLGWDQAPLVAAAEWILAAYGDDLGELIVALPGARAARRLLELLVERAGPGWTPPRVLTQGELIDELVRLEHPPAERLARTLVWERALAELEPDRVERLARPGGGPLLRERIRLAEAVRTLHGEVAPEGKDFAALLRGPARPEIETEAERWEVLAAAQRGYRGILERLGLADPHEARLRAIEDGRLDRLRRVVLVGVADMNHLLARLLAEVRDQVTVLVVASEKESEGFDELGRLRADWWREQDVPLRLDQWHVAEKPVDQAEAAARILVRSGTRAADQVSIGVADEEVVPYLERRLRAAGATARSAAGTPVEHTRPARLLRAVSRFLARGGFPELAALARDPDLGPALFRDAAPAARLDAYQVEHLPKSGRGGWAEDARHTPAVRVIHERLEERLGELAADEERALTSWAPAIRDLLARVYSARLDPEVEAERLLAEALRALGRVLGELEAVPAGLAGPDVSASEAIDLVLRGVRGERVPPAPRRAGEPTVELLGWLDLPLDDAPTVVVTGFEEGRVPRAVGGHAFLPDGTRRRLGLPSDDDRLARDVYATTVLLSTGRDVSFVTGRRNVDGDPLVPSRIAFHRPATEVVAAVRHFLPAEEEPRVPDLLGGGEGVGVRPRLADTPPLEAMSVSSFRLFLKSPYHFYLERVLRLKTLDDRARELNPLQFGNLAHDVLEVFGKSELRESSDENEIAEFLASALDRLVRDRFGDPALPAVTLQAYQLRHRLRIFARAQAERRREGWHIRAVEWEPPEEAATLEVDGDEMRLRGRIDRIDSHDDGRWAILDYKSGENPKEPGKAHRRRNGEWIDLQLPLYRHLAHSFEPQDDVELVGEPLLGYGRVGKSETEIGFDFVDWNEADLQEALDMARNVVRRVRAGDFEEQGKPPYEEILRAMWGVGMVGASADDGEGSA